jgi:amicyanin
MKHIFKLSLPVVLLALAGCGSSSSPSPSSPSPSSAPASTSAPPSGGSQVTIQNLAFSPKVVHAKVGQTVVWTNQDTPPHNVTYVSGPKFASSPPTMTTGAKFTVKLTKAGTIRYYCTIHPFMKGTVVVSP